MIHFRRPITSFPHYDLCIMFPTHVRVHTMYMYSTRFEHGVAVETAWTSPFYPRMVISSNVVNLYTRVENIHK